MPEPHLSSLGVPASGRAELMGKRRNTAVASVEAVPDIREAARQEAGREGLSIGSWLDGVMAEHAAALGVDTAQLDPAQRVEAVMARLDRVAPRQTDDGSGDTGKLRTGVHANSADSFSEPDQPIRNAEQDTRRSGMPAVALLRESFEDMAMDNDRAGSAGDPLQTRAGREADAMRTAASSSVNGTSTIDMPSEAARAARAASRQAAQRLEIETKLNALFKALDRTPRRTDHAAAATAADRQDDEPETREALLGRTAITPSWRLEKAIGEIAQRQSFLDRQAQADTASTPVVTSGTPFGSPRAAADDLRRHFASPPRTEMSAVPHVATHRPSAAASIFTTLQGDIARLAERLDTVDATRRPPAPPAQRSEAGLDALGRQVETLSAKIDAMRDHRVPLEAIDRLSRRIEDVHAEVSTRMTAQVSQPAIDMASIEALIRDVVDRADRTGKAAPDLHGLESAVHDLAAKLAMAERSQDGSEVLASLQAQVRVLAERMDKTDAGLTAIVAIERSLGEVFGQMGEMRDAVVQTAQVTAQTVARESIQAALEDGRRERLRGAEPGLPFVDQVNQEFAELRSDRDEADKRLHAILAALNTSLERVVDRLGALEDEAAGVRAATADRTSPSLLSRQPLALDFTEAAGVTPEVGGALVAPREVEDLIEPGVTSRQWSNPAQAGTPAAVPSAPDPTSFIAAARRAAQAATAEHSARLDAQLDRQRARPAADRGKAKRSATGMVARPLVIALASLAILAGAAQIIRLSLVATDPAADATATASAPPTVAKSDAGVPAVAPEKPTADADLEAPVPSVPPAALRQLPRTPRRSPRLQRKRYRPWRGAPLPTSRPCRRPTFRLARQQPGCSRQACARLPMPAKPERSTNSACATGTDAAWHVISRWRPPGSGKQPIRASLPPPTGSARSTRRGSA